MTNVILHILSASGLSLHFCGAFGDCSEVNWDPDREQGVRIADSMKKGSNYFSCFPCCWIGMNVLFSLCVTRSRYLIAYGKMPLVLREGRY